MSSRLLRTDSTITDKWSEYADGVNWAHYNIEKPPVNAQEALDLLKTEKSQHLRKTVENLLAGYFGKYIHKATSNDLCVYIENYFPDCFPSCFKLKLYPDDASKINYIPESHTYASFPLFKGSLDKPQYCLLTSWGLSS
eukprot:NODE_11_length_46995_cov_0.451872.p23 type:complete len:139 gc:universal NODE_11_length_46995_cov_0.451872:41035-40619(-)